MSIISAHKKSIKTGIISNFTQKKRDIKEEKQNSKTVIDSLSLVVDCINIWYTFFVFCSIRHVWSFNTAHFMVYVRNYTWIIQLHNELADN